MLMCLVCEQLPITLSPGDVEHNPEFGKLLKALTQHILPNGSMVASDKDMQEVSILVVYRVWHKKNNPLRKYLWKDVT